MFRFLPATLALAVLATAPGCLPEGSEFESLAAAATGGQGHGGSAREGAGQRPAHQRLAGKQGPWGRPGPRRGARGRPVSGWRTYRRLGRHRTAPGPREPGPSPTPSPKWRGWLRREW